MFYACTNHKGIYNVEKYMMFIMEGMNHYICRLYSLNYANFSFLLFYKVAILICDLV